MKKPLILLIFMLFINFNLPVIAEEIQSPIQFSDLNESLWAFESIEKLVNVGIINGYPDGTFEPEGSIIRAELVKIVNLIYSYTEKQEIISFTDIALND